MKEIEEQLEKAIKAAERLKQSKERLLFAQENLNKVMNGYPMNYKRTAAKFSKAKMWVDIWEMKLKSEAANLYSLID